MHIIKIILDLNDVASWNYFDGNGVKGTIEEAKMISIHGLVYPCVLC